MPKKISVAITLVVFVLFNTTIAFAIPENIGCQFTNNSSNFGCDTGLFCKPTVNNPDEDGICTKKLAENIGCQFTNNSSNFGCDTGLFCKPTVNNPDEDGICTKSEIKNIFGTIQPPDALKGFLQKDPTGAGAISQFLSNFVALLFSIAAIVLIFMILWGAFEWLTSGGDKEKLSSAQKRIINAFIGIILFAVAFAIIRVVGTFTGFTFFSGQNFTVMDRDSQGNIIKVRCNNGKFVFYSKNFPAECQKP